MRSLGLLCSFCLLSSVVSQTIPELLRNVTQAFYDAKIVPDVIEAVKLSAFVNMRFTDDSGESVTPSPGEILTMLREPFLCFLDDKYVDPDWKKLPSTLSIS